MPTDHNSQKKIAHPRMIDHPPPGPDDPTREDQASTLALQQFLDILRRLRRECPWDRKQTHASLRPMLIEETYETIEAIDMALDTGDYTELKKELGDLLLHILFHSELGREAGHFTLSDVLHSESEKLIYRHPHVFGDVKADTPEEVARNWEQLKRRESGRNSVLDGVPKSLPALQRAARIQERASKVGFDWTDSVSVWKKVREELLEFEHELHKTPEALKDKQPEEGAASRVEETLRRPEVEDEFGDILFSLVNLARHEGLDPEHCLREATHKFERRFRQVETRVESTGRPMQSFTLEELDAIWDEVKRNLG
jgi:MazG family protein